MELRVLFMEDIVFTVVPIMEGRMIRTGLLNWFGWFNDICFLWSSSLALLSPILRFVRRPQIHLVWINDFAFFLKIEGLLMAFDISLSKLSIVVLSIV